LALRKLERYDGAIANFDRALALRPDFYLATRSKLFTLIKAGRLKRYLLSQNPIDQEHLRNDVQNICGTIVKTKLPAMVVISLSLFYSLGGFYAFMNGGLAIASRFTAITGAAIVLALSLIGEWMDEKRK